MVAQAQNTQRFTRSNSGARFTKSIAKRLSDGTVFTFFPVVTTAASFAEKGLCPVRGGISIPNTHKGAAFNLDTRWATLTPAEVKAAWLQGKKDGTIHSVRVSSLVAGNERGAGSEAAYLVELNGSDEAKAIAEALGVNYGFTTQVGRDQNVVDVSHENGLIITQDAAIELENGYLSKIEGLQREYTPASRADSYNPTLQELIAMVKATGELPARQQVRANTATIDDISSMFN